MASAKIEVKDQDILEALRQLLGSILRIDDVKALLVPSRLPMKQMVMPMLITDPDRLDGIDPLAPAYPMNTAKVVSKLSRKPVGGTIVVVMRPCEIRAFIELVKLKQGRLEELIILSIDCLGAFRNADYLRLAGGDRPLTSLDFCRSALAGKTGTEEGIDIAPACRACEYPVAEGADVVIGLLGVDVDDHLLLQSQSEKGSNLLSRLDLPSAPTEKNREQVIADLVARRSAYRDEMFSATGQAVQDLERLTTYLAGCVNCYNCRVACPVCYCKECVFVTDVFNHEPIQYLQWAQRKGMIKMPTDTVFYHLTRLAHMSTACVGCGQCSNACPNDIQVMELFRTVAQSTQQAFDYVAGRGVDEKPPLSEFRENEFNEVVGIGLK
ncbi:MAG: 4Fe-4S dicluster domain-containing protein [Desulfobacterales bacterium]|nr:4Fe-4S dicluster domain-containing protein [Desulfobacterales bacterium]